MKTRLLTPGQSTAERRASSVPARSVQLKPAVSQPGDRFEQEADRVARAVSRGEPAPMMAGRAAAGIQRKCAACEEEAKANRREPTTDSGSPLPASSRTFFERRMGNDFRDVRVHTGSRAAKSASAMNALAYTSGNDIVFGKGQYRPETTAGRELLAHELTHVVQQRNSAGNTPDVQRLGDPSQAPANLACELATTSAPDVFSDIYFPISSNTLDAANVAKIAGFIATWEQAGAEDQIRVDGFASTDGPEPLNWTLSCNRAQAVVRELENPTGGQDGIPPQFITEVFANGETDQFGPDLELNRRATIAADLTEPPPCANPGVLRTLDLQPVFLRTDPADPAPTGATWTPRLTSANQIWGKVGVSFVELSPVTLDTADKAAGDDAASQARIRALRSAAGVEVFLVDNDMPGSGGANTLPPIGAGCGANGNIVMSDRGTSDTLLAHELGHILGLDHPTDLPPFNPGDPNTILEPSGSNSIANPTRNTIVNYSRILCPDPSGSICLNPDP